MNTVKILSVDDEADLELLLTQYFRRKIRQGEYEFFFAHNGLEALDVLQEHPDIDIILSDINMPEMDGLTLLSKVNEKHNPALKFIIVSAYGDMGNIRSAMNKGAFDFTTKPIDLDDLSLTIEKAIGVIDYVKSAQEEHTQLETIKTDLVVAAQIQQAILPRVFPPFPEFADKMDIAAKMIPAKDVGGDFYDFFRLDDERIGLIIADVSGKGVPASIFMAVSRTLIRTVALQGGTPAECLSTANNLLSQESVNSMFVTVFYAIYNTKTGAIDYCNGGHNQPCVMHADGTLEMLSMTNSYILGAFAGLPYQNGKARLGVGDTLLMYTDGVNEAFNTSFEQYGDSRMIKALEGLCQKNSQEIIDGLHQDVNAFVGEAPQSDDITLLALKRKV